MAIFKVNLYTLAEDSYLSAHLPLIRLLEQFGNLILLQENKVISYLSEDKLAAEVDVTLVNKQEIRQMNQEYRHVDRETDVLSFPNFEFRPSESDSDYHFPIFEYIEPDSDSPAVSLGEIILCPDIVQLQANSLNQTYVREFCFLFMHGLLHLCGYDHQTEEQEHRMFALQRCLSPELDTLIENFGVEELSL